MLVLKARRDTTVYLEGLERRDHLESLGKQLTSLTST